MKKLSRQLLGFFFGICILTFTVIFILLPDKVYSASEKRNLTQFPKFSIDRILSGALMEDLEDYTADQFPFRDFFMKVKTTALRALGQNESNGVYLMKDGSMAERFDMPENANTEETILRINDFISAHKDTSTYFMLVPNAISICPELRPLHAVTDDQNAYIYKFKTALSKNENLSFVDVRDTFLSEKNTTDLYYRTDHHWTTAGAYTAFKLLADVMDLENIPEFTPSTVSNNFYGTMVSESGFTASRPDSVEIYTPVLPDAEMPLYTVTYPEENKKTASVYETAALSGDNAYEVFFGGNHPLITIETAQESNRNVLIIKDSYANALIPFLIPECSKITILDPRYYYDNIDLLTQQESFTDVIFLYNVNTLSEDTVLKTVLNNVQ